MKKLSSAATQRVELREKIKAWKHQSANARCSQRDLAKKLGKSECTISRVLKNWGPSRKKAREHKEFMTKAVKKRGRKSAKAVFESKPNRALSMRSCRKDREFVNTNDKARKAKMKSKRVDEAEEFKNDIEAVESNSQRVYSSQFGR